MYTIHMLRAFNNTNIIISINKRRHITINNMLPRHSLFLLLSKAICIVYNIILLFFFFINKSVSCICMSLQQHHKQRATRNAKNKPQLSALLNFVAMFTVVKFSYKAFSQFKFGARL